MTATTATTSGAAIRVGLLTPYFAVFEGRFPPTYRASQALQAGGLAEALRMRGLEVGESGVVDGAQSAAGAAIRGARLEPAGPAGGHHPGLRRRGPRSGHCRRQGLGIATRFAFDAGPATIVAFGPATASRPARFVASVGRLTGRGFEHLNGPSGTITFDTPGVGRASSAWIDAGPAHHLALVRGDRMLEFRAAARVMGGALIEVTAGAV